MTVLGNIVAVTSIIAVVSLIQGLNASVTDAIVSGVGADSFTIQRMPIIRSEEDEERVRNNPRITLDEATAIRQFSDNIGAVAGAGRRRGARSPTATSRSTARRSRASPRDYVNFSTFDAERGRLMSPTEVDAAAPGRPSSAGTSPTGCSAPLDPLDKIISDRRRRTSASSASARRRARSFGHSQDEFAIIPLGAFQMMFGSRRSLQLHRQAARRPTLVQGGDGRCDAWRCASSGG